MTIGERIKALRHKKGWSQRELARLAGIRRATLIDLETGASPGTRTDIARRLAKAFGVTLDYLAGMYGDEDDASCLTGVGGSPSRRSRENILRNSSTKERIKRKKSCVEVWEFPRPSGHPTNAQEIASVCRQGLHETTTPKPPTGNPSSPCRYVADAG